MYFCAEMEAKSRAIVLRALKYGDAQMIVDLFTREQGRLSFICHLPKTSKGRIKKQFFQPLSILEIVFDYRSNRSLQHFKDIRLSLPYVSVPFDAGKLSISLFLSEFLTYALYNEQHNEQLYSYVENSLMWLDNAQERYANFHLVFTMRLSMFIGFFPNIDDFHDGWWFDLRNGSFTSLQPLHPDCLEPVHAKEVHSLMRMTYENMHLFRMNKEQRNRCTDIILYYYRLHVPGFPQLHSLDVVKTLF